MSEPLPAWKITPPLDPGAPFHVWHEGDQTWGEAHADWDAAPTAMQPIAAAEVLRLMGTENQQTSLQLDQVIAAIEMIAEFGDALIAHAASAALPALAEVLRLWPFPAVDIEPVRELVGALSELDTTSQ